MTHVHGHPITLLGATVSSRVGAAGAAIAGGRPVVELHEADDPAVHRALDAVRRELAVPLRLGGRVRGALVISSYVAHPGFSAADVELAQALARLASLAVETAQAYDERGAQARIDRASSELTAELAMARNSDGLRESLARVARQTLGADAARVRLAAELEDGLASTGAGADRRSSCWRCASAASSPRAVSAATRASRRRSAAACPAPRCWRCRSRTTARAPPPASSRCCGAARASSTTPTSRSPSACASPRPPRSSASQLEEAERRASTTARELQRVGALLAADLDPRAVLRADRRAGRQPARRRRLRAAPARGGRARAARGRGRAGREPRRRAPARSATCSRPRCSRPRGPSRSTTSPPTAALAPDDPVLKAGFASWAGAPIASADGGVQGMLAIFGAPPAAPPRRRGRGARGVRQLGLRRAAQRAPLRGRREREGRVAAILGRVADAIVATDADDRIMLWNAAAERITQIPERRALGRVLAELLHERARRRRRHRRTACSRGAGAIADRGAARARRARDLALGHGRRHERRATGGPGRVLAMRDVSEERALDQLKSDFVATVSHELRTPLTSIYGFAETLLREDASFGEEDRASFVRYIASEAERLNRLVDGLLSAARLETGAVGLDARAGRRRRGRARGRARGPAAAPSSTSSRSCCRPAARSPRPTPTACARC